MMRCVSLAALVCCWPVLAARDLSPREQSSLAGLALYERFRELLAASVTPRDRARNIETARRDHRFQEEVPVDRPFPCDTSRGRSPSPPESAHRLRPGDVDVVAAMGDSLTASFGNAATSLRQVLIENRGMSWAGGGEGTWRQYLTLPNILKEFNPRLVGYSLRDSLSHQKASQFNVAEGGAMSRDLPWQAKLLVRRIRSDPRVDVNKHWKLVTMMIGGNDFCSEMCFHSDPWQVLDYHRRDLTATLDYLLEHLPRTLVNIAIVPHLQLLFSLINKPALCDLTHYFECQCLFTLPHQHRRHEFFEIMRQWQKIDEEMAASPRYSGLAQFAVVAQPFAKNLAMPIVEKAGVRTTDFSYTSQDCFHFSQKGSATAANGLWNNMLEPVGNKTSETNPPFSRFLCPTEDHPYIYTNENSDF